MQTLTGLHIAVSCLTFVCITLSVSGNQLPEKCQEAEALIDNLSATTPRDDDGCVMQFKTNRGTCCLIGMKLNQREHFKGHYFVERLCFKLKCLYGKKKRWEKCKCRKNKVKLPRKKKSRKSKTKKAKSRKSKKPEKNPRRPKPLSKGGSATRTPPPSRTEKPATRPIQLPHRSAPISKFIPTRRVKPASKPRRRRPRPRPPKKPVTLPLPPPTKPATLPTKPPPPPTKPITKPPPPPTKPVILPTKPPPPPTKPPPPPTKPVTLPPPPPTKPKTKPPPPPSFIVTNKPQPFETEPIIGCVVPGSGNIYPPGVEIEELKTRSGHTCVSAYCGENGLIKYDEYDCLDPLDLTTHPPFGTTPAFRFMTTLETDLNGKKK